MDQKHTPHHVDKITILSLDRLECWSGFMKLLVGKKDFSRKQSTGRKRVNIDPPTFHLKHASRNIELSYLHTELFNKRMIRLTMAFSSLAILLYNPGNRSAVQQIQKLLATTLIIKDAKQVVVVALTEKKSKCDSAKHDQMITMLTYHGVKSHIVMDLRCKSPKELINNFKSLLVNKLCTTSDLSSKQMALKRERPAYNGANNAGLETSSKISRFGQKSSMSKSPMHPETQQTKGQRSVSLGTNPFSKKEQLPFVKPYRSKGEQETARRHSLFPSNSPQETDQDSGCFPSFLSRGTSFVSTQSTNMGASEVKYTHIQSKDFKYTHIQLTPSAYAPWNEDKSFSFVEDDLLSSVVSPKALHANTKVENPVNAPSYDSKMSKFMDACAAAQLKLRMLFPASEQN